MGKAEEKIRTYRGAKNPRWIKKIKNNDERERVTDLERKGNWLDESDGCCWKMVCRGSAFK